jgi:phosphoribosylformylglycinamidine synthase PurS subunit
MWQAKIVVTYKAGILNPEAKIIQQALGNLGYQKIAQLETGRYIQIQYDNDLDRSQVETLTRELGDKILSNPVIQKYDFELVEVQP